MEGCVGGDFGLVRRGGASLVMVRRPANAALVPKGGSAAYEAYEA